MSGPLASGKEFKGDGPIRTRPCRYFSSNRSCRFGDHCKFLHENNDEAVSVEPPFNSPEDPISVDNLHQKQSQDGAVVKEQSFKTQDGNSQDISRKHDKHDSVDKKRQCFQFKRNGNCRFGEECRFSHALTGRAENRQSNENHVIDDRIKPHNEAEIGSEPAQRVESISTKGGNSSMVKKPKQVKKKICRYFQAGHCALKERCRFVHSERSGDGDVPIDLETLDEVDVSALKAGIIDQPVVKPRFRQHTKRKVFKPEVFGAAPLLLEKITEEDVIKLRSTDIQQLLKRYPKAEVIIEDRCFGIKFAPTDPDWPFDVKEVDLQIVFSKKYPQKTLKVFVSEDQALPDTVRRFVKNSIDDWITRRKEELDKAKKVEIIFRPFLKWLDKNLEEIFTAGLKQYQKELVAKASGFEFIPATQLQEMHLENSTSEESDTEDDVGDTYNEDVEEKTVDELGELEESEEAEEMDEDKGGTELVDNVQRRGIELKLMMLQMLENVATILASKIMLVLQCKRCKNQIDFTTPPKRTNALNCLKCSSQLLVTFRVCHAHQFSSVIGYLDLDGCIPFDIILPECSFIVNCMECSTDMKVEGWNPGQVKTSWCQNCHAKIQLATENVRFTELQPTSNINSGTIHIVQQTKIKRVAKDPAIQDGKPLPNEGTCKHYKKSYRWLRFPCCGKTYPCDVCHDENEGDHEMKFANRMICGFCCKEQPYAAEKPCVACNSSMTNKSTSHWEGGKGCRDVIKMAKTDSQKYAGSKKTISRKAFAKKTNVKQTKVRKA